MAFNPTFQDKFMFLYRDHLCLQPKIPTMFPPPISAPIPPPHKNPLINHTSPFHHFHDHNPTFPMEGFSSISNLSSVPSVPLLGESSQAAMPPNFFVNPNINRVALAPNNKIEALYRDHLCLQQKIPTMFPPPISAPIPPPHKNPLINHTSPFQHFHDHNPTLPMEGFSSISNLSSVPSVPLLGESSQAAMPPSCFVNPNINPMALAPNNKIEALYGHQGGPFMSDLEKNVAFQSSVVFASSPSQSSPSLSQPPLEVDYDDHGSMMRTMHAGDLSYHTEINDIDHDGEQMKSVKEDRDNKTAKKTKRPWSAQEDKLFVELVNQHGPKNWTQVAKLMKKRTGKQCRDRWNNHLKPEIKKKPWTREEDIILIKSHQKVGNKWVEIAKNLPGRSENTVKNHWNAAKRRLNIHKRKNNNPNAYEGSILQAYIKRVTTAKKAERDTDE